MNTIGKILVILNLVFALLVGGFLVIDFATRTNWKVAYEKLRNEMEIASKNHDMSGRTLRDTVNLGKRDKAENDDLKQKLVEEEALRKAREASLQLKIEEANAKVTEADLNAQKLIAEKDRLKEEVKGLNATVLNRDATILTLQAESKTFRAQAIAQGNIATAMQSRNEHLLAQNQDLLRKLAQQDSGSGGAKDPSRDPNAPNPPSTYVRGKIAKIDSVDRNLVELSIGTDQGLNKKHTLEVYRLSPTPEYLGMIRIMDATQHTAVGKLVRTGISGNRGPLQVGDIVASSLNNQSQ